MMTKTSRSSFFVSGFLALIFVLGLMVTLQSTPASAQGSKPTRTPRPAPTASTTPVPSVDLPAWMRDPDTDVVVLYPEEGDDSGAGATFINAATGERFPLNLPYVDSVGWVKTEDGVYIQLLRYQSSGADNSDGFQEYINLETGALVRYGLSDPGRPVHSVGTSTPLMKDNGADISYQLDSKTVTLWTVVDETQHYYQLQTYGDITVTDATSGKTTSLYSQQPLNITNVQGLDVEWFNKGQFLGVWLHYLNPVSDMYHDGGGDHVDIFDTSGTFVQSFDTLIQVRWSNAHGKMLYRDFYDRNSICIIDTQDTADSDCDALKKWQSRQGNQIQDYQWSVDGEKIIFTYVSDDQKAGGLCVVDATTLGVDCPIKKELTNGSLSGVYRYRPDNTYGFFTYSNRVPGNGFGSDAIPRETGFCLLNQQTYAADCLTDRVLPANTYYHGVSISPSHHLAAMLYTRPTLDGRDGICPIDLQSGAVTCSDISGIYGGFIDTFGWSPDSRFFLAMYGYGPGSDDKSFTRFGIYDMVTGIYRDEGFAMYENNISELWRPSLKP